MALNNVFWQEFGVRKFNRNEAAKRRNKIVNRARPIEAVGRRLASFPLISLD